MGCQHAVDLMTGYVKNLMDKAQVTYNNEYQPYANEEPLGRLNALKDLYEDLKTNRFKFILDCKRAQGYKDE